MGSGWGTHVNPWLIHVNIWQKPLQYCKVISLQLIKINEKNKIIIMPNITYFLERNIYIYIYTHTHIHTQLGGKCPPLRNEL